MKSENNLRMQLKEALDNLWARIKSLVSGLDTRVTALEQGGGGGGQVNVIEAISFNGTNVPPDSSKRVSLQEADPTVPSWAKAASKPTYTASEVGALADTTTFVSGVKGAAEAAYRSGQVELSPVNIGALALSGGEMTGDINMGQSGATSGAKNIKWTTADGTMFYIRPYNNLFQIVRMPSGGTASNALGIYSDGSVSMDNPANWRSAIGVTPANINAATQITIPSTSTWSDMYALFITIPTAATATFFCGGGSASSLLSGGNYSNVTTKGVISRVNSTTYDVIASIGEGNSLGIWRINGLSSASATPTITGFKGFVSNAGDTMSGSLTINGGAINSTQGAYTNTGFNYSQLPSEARSATLAAARDSNSVIRNQVYMVQNPNGNYITMLQARDGQGATCYIGAGLDPSGNPVYYVSNSSVFRSTIGAAAATAAFYSATGIIIKSYGGTGTTVGYGRAVVNIRGKAVEVNFEAQIVTAGTVAALYDVGLSVATLRSLNSSIPAFTASNGGLIHYYTSSGAIATNREGYAGVGEVQAASNQWRLARVYNTSGSVGAWGDDVYTVGMRIVGTVYGTLS